MTERRGPSPLWQYVGERSLAIVTWLGGFLRANLPVWIGIAVVLFAYYCVMDQQGM